LVVASHFSDRLAQDAGAALRAGLLMFEVLRDLAILPPFAESNREYVYRQEAMSGK
jgi:hypothetical protein